MTLELLARHLKNVVVVDAQGGTHRFGGAGNSAWKSGICACSGPSSNPILRAGGYAFKRESRPDPDSEGSILHPACRW